MVRRRVMQGGWALNPDIHVRVWDEDVLVYVPATGDTHLLDGRLAHAFHGLANRDAVQVRDQGDVDVDALHTLASLQVAVESMASCASQT